MIGCINHIKERMQRQAHRLEVTISRGALVELLRLVEERKLLEAMPFRVLESVKPVEPPNRVLREGDRGDKCGSCGSSVHRSGFLFNRYSLGCLNTKCSQYWG